MITGVAAWLVLLFAVIGLGFIVLSAVAGITGRRITVVRRTPRPWDTAFSWHDADDAVTTPGPVVRVGGLRHPHRMFASCSPSCPAHRDPRAPYSDAAPLARPESPWYNPGLACDTSPTKPWRPHAKDTR